MSEKQSIERSTAGAFVELYNLENKSTYRVVEYSDAPDVRCKNDEGHDLDIEVTLTEDRPGDIQAVLGRSNRKTIDSQREHLARVRAGKANIFDRVSSLSGNVTEMLVQRIMAKSNMDYGKNAALVVRDSSPVGWDWENVAPEIAGRLKNVKLPFRRGVWLVTFTKDRIIRII